MNDRNLMIMAGNMEAHATERADARAEIQQLYHPTASDMPGTGEVSELVKSVMYAWESQDPAILDKGLGLSYGGPSGAGGANQMNGMLTSTGLRNNNREPKPGEPKSIFVDERGVFGTVPGGFKRRPSLFGPEHLRMMVENMPLLNAVILRRDRTIKRFLRPNERSRDMKFEVRKADDSGKVRGKKGTEENKVESFLLHSGWEENPGVMRQMHRDTLPKFISKSIRDILTLDAWAIETIPTRNGRSIDGYHAIDAATIYLASEQGYMGDDAIMAVQVVNGLPYTVYTDEELTYGVMNPRSDVLHSGYGYAPPEMIVKVVTGYLNALTYNLKGFDSNAIPKGILNIYGNFKEKEVEAFKQHWNASVRGVNNAWALPVMISENKDSKAEFMQFNEKFTDLYFAKWMVLLTSIVCSIYGMDPNEIYSEHFSAGKSSLSGSDAAERLAEARDTGLEPLMSYIEDVLTANIVKRVAGPDFVFRFLGIQPTDKERQHEVENLTMSVRQLAEEYGVEPADEDWVDAPANPNLMAAYIQGKQEEMGGPMDGFDGGSGGDGVFGQPTAKTSIPGQTGMTPAKQRSEDRTHQDLKGPDKAGRDQQVFRKAATGEILVVG